jgi:phage terminase small subunit
MTDRQRAFLDAYLAGRRRNATRAATAAGYAFPDKQGPRLTHFPAIAAEIRAANERRAAEFRAEIKAEREARLAGGAVPWRKGWRRAKCM